MEQHKQSSMLNHDIRMQEGESIKSKVLKMEEIEQVKKDMNRERIKKYMDDNKTMKANTLLQKQKEK